MKIKQGKMRILLACADESLLKQTKRLMQASNELELVGSTSNGTKAWEMIRQKNAGYGRVGYRPAVCGRLCRCVMDETEGMWDTSIILLSSFIGGQTYVECSLLHINVLLRKPICADALYERIKLAVNCTSRGDTVEQRLAQILRELGADVRTINRTTVEIDCSHIRNRQVPYELARKIRASYYLVGACWAASAGQRCPCRRVQSGGRPIDQHIKGFVAMGPRWMYATA